MLKSIEIQDLRGIRQGSLAGFTELNVVVGPNHAGKSTILDAFHLEPIRSSEGSRGSLEPKKCPGAWQLGGSTRLSCRAFPSHDSCANRQADTGRLTTLVRKPPTATSDGSSLELQFVQTIHHKQEHFHEPAIPPPLGESPTFGSWNRPLATVLDSFLIS